LLWIDLSQFYFGVWVEFNPLFPAGANVLKALCGKINVFEIIEMLEDGFRR